MGQVDTIQVPVFAAESPRYEVDFNAWAIEQAARLRLLRVPGLDIENLAEEIEALARRDRHSLASRVVCIVAHLLKWRYQPSHRGKSWQLTLIEQRRRLAMILDDSPSLRRIYPDVVATQYPAAAREASAETTLTATSFPAACEWSPEEILDPDFLPLPA